MEIGESRKLKWEDVDLEKGKAWIVDPKNGEAVKIELSRRALEIISKQQKRGLYSNMGGMGWFILAY